MNLDPISTNELNPIISNWFSIHPMGITVKNGVDRPEPPPIDAIDLLGYYLSFKTDELKWQVGAWCNLYINYYGTDVYHQKSSIVKRKPQTIEVWAYVERNIPDHIRLPGVSFECHRLVASIKNHRLQYTYLRLCRLFNLKYKEFEQWLRDKSLVENSQPSYQDQLFVAQQEAYNSEVKRQEAETRADKAERKLNQSTQLAESPILPPPTTGPDLTDLDWTHLLQVKDTLIDNGYTSVTVWSNGDITWHR